MIEGRRAEGFTLTCDFCGDEAEEQFEEFRDAVDFKKENGWRSVQNRNGEWRDLCPACTSPDVIRRVRESDD